MAGETSFQADIAGVTQANPCVVTTAAAHGYQTNQIVRITDVGSSMPTPRGMEQLDGNRYRITVLTTTTFSLQDPVSGEDVDSTNFNAWVSNGKVNMTTRVISLNNPESYPYSETNQYVSNAFKYEA